MLSSTGEGSYRQSANGRIRRKITFKTYQRPPVLLTCKKSLPEGRFLIDLSGSSGKWEGFCNNYLKKFHEFDKNFNAISPF
jgi:hypothetical protein